MKEEREVRGRVAREPTGSLALRLLNCNSNSARQYRGICTQLDLCGKNYVTVGDQPGIFSQDRSDAERVESMFSHYFLDCYHLKDYIKNDVMIPLELRSKVERFASSNEIINLLGDVANSKKHLHLTKPRVSPNVKLKHTPILLGPAGTYPAGGIYKYVLEIETDSRQNNVDALVFAKKCKGEWEKFFRQGGYAFA